MQASFLCVASHFPMMNGKKSDCGANSYLLIQWMELFKYECTQFAGNFRTEIVYDETENGKHRINCMIFICLILSVIWWLIRRNWMQNSDRKWSNTLDNVIKIEGKRKKNRMSKIQLNHAAQIPTLIFIILCFEFWWLNFWRKFTVSRTRIECDVWFYFAIAIPLALWLNGKSHWVSLKVKRNEQMYFPPNIRNRKIWKKLISTDTKQLKKLFKCQPDMKGSS